MHNTFKPLDSQPQISQPNVVALTASSWQKDLQQAIKTPQQLFKILNLPAEYLPAAEQAAKLFPLRVPVSFVQRMQMGDINDPLLRQVLPLDAEYKAQPASFLFDPVGDENSMAVPGLLHKYHGRALLITTGACAVHCRYCFRRHYPYNDASAKASQLAPALEYLRNDSSIEEVLLSGGDPLSLPDEKLAALVNELENIPHLKRLRIHTRQPVVLPSRVDDRLLAWLNKGRLQTIVVLHINHANEINHELATAIKKLKNTGVTLLNQAVLLAGVNDSAETQIALSQALFANHVLPYYLHQLDKVQGAAHFEVSDEIALDIHSKIQARLPGYLVPRLVREIAGEKNKTPLSKMT